MDSFYLHEDEWAMIDLVPIENCARSEETARDAEKFSAEHRAPGGVGWTDMFILPAQPHPLSQRNLSLEELATLLGAEFQRRAEVVSGYSSYREPVPTAFAFSTKSGSSLYGDSDGSIVKNLHLDKSGDESEALAGALLRLGRAQRLMLCDWWSHRFVDLSDETAVKKYLVDD